MIKIESNKLFFSDEIILDYLEKSEKVMEEINRKYN